jgi:hypothetical protein
MVWASTTLVPSSTVPSVTSVGAAALVEARYWSTPETSSVAGVHAMAK